MGRHSTTDAFALGKARPLAPNPRRRTARKLALGLACCIGAAIGGSALAVSYSEAAIKAAYLHRFASYVEWPAPADTREPFVIGVFGADDVAAELERLLPGRRIQNRQAVVRRLQPGDLPGRAQILYVGTEHLSRARDALIAAEGEPVLVVTDDEGGLARGGVINFVRVDRSLRFEVSLVAAQRHRLKISSGLLSVASRVESESVGDKGA